MCSTPSLTGWVNDICPVNYNPTVIPVHQTEPSKLGILTPRYLPTLPLLGRTVTTSAVSHTGQRISNSFYLFWNAPFDSRERNWDLACSSNPELLFTLNPAEASATKSSVYALAGDPYGLTIASGSPERIDWSEILPTSDPILTPIFPGKLVEHTDTYYVLYSYPKTPLNSGPLPLSVASIHSPIIPSPYGPCSPPIPLSNRATPVVTVLDTRETAIAEGVNKIAALDDNAQSILAFRFSHFDPQKDVVGHQIDP
ncbi:hypothetical protein C8R42DRAFT_728478 [Lentinula raphanica]|nr:hypothetical protein C8R42DRAFT_728478 [Lentinula raphanica]